MMVIFFGKYAQRMGRRFAAGQRWRDEIRGKEVSGSRLAAPRREFGEQKGMGEKMRQGAMPQSEGCLRGICSNPSSAGAQVKVVEGV
jgi:hypothetical protein